MRVALFVTCLVDLMRPRIGFSSLRLLEAAGCEVVVPETQTCCGQPAFNGGDRAAAAMLARKVIAEFEGYDYVVAPSGSCADHIRNEYPGLLADEPSWQARATALAPKVYELTDFLVNVAGMTQPPGRFRGSITYHDSCSGLRSLGIKAQPRQLLAAMPGVEVREMDGAEECCGFGGTFSVKFGDVSAAILGCLLNIEGKLRRMGDDRTRVLHIAEVLSGEQ
jgi:L-lactate dehydrogenase complex protein LldE